MRKMGASIALCTAMTLTSVGGMLPAKWGIETAYADETKAASAKTFTADRCEKCKARYFFEGCCGQ